MAEATTRRRELPEVRREQILDAAATVFLDRGLTQATMADVAEAAGVAKGTIYLYFDSKSAVLTALRARYTGQWLAQSGRLDTPPDRGGHPRQLRSFLAEMYDFHAANQRLHHLLFHVPARRPPRPPAALPARRIQGSLLEHRRALRRPEPIV